MTDNKVFFSDLAYTFSGLVLGVLPWIVCISVLTNAEVDPTTKSTVAVSLFGTSVAGSVLGRRQPDALKELVGRK